MSETLIIGAGPAGLTAAYEMLRLGLRPTVLEAGGQVGGLARTVEYRGYRFDIGGHRFFSKVSLVNTLWREILGDDLLPRERLSRILYRGRLFDYPLKPLSALTALGPLEAALICLSYARAKLSPRPQENTFEDWVSNRFGQRLYRTFFKTYTEKVWGVSGAEISADWAAQRIKNLSLTEAVRNALLRRNRGLDGQVITTLIDRFHYPRLGPGMMWERCADLVAQRGGQVLRGMRVERLRHDGGRVVCVRVRTDSGDTLEIDTREVVSTMPVRDLIHALDPPPPAPVLRAADALHHRDHLTVVLIVRHPALFPDNWLYVHAPEVKLGRVQNYKNWSAEMVPDPSRSSLGLEYFVGQGDDEWRWSDARLIDLGIRDCARLGLVRPADVEDGTVVKQRAAYPLYDRGYDAHLATVRRHLQGIVNLQSAGRNGLHRYNNQDHSMLTGIYAARNLRGARHDVWSVNTERSYHEGPAPERDAAGAPVALPAGALGAPPPA